MSSDEDLCHQHSGHIARIHALEENRGEIWTSLDRAHERLDAVKNWVIAGMTSLIIQLVLMVIGGAYAYAKLKGMTP